MMFFRILEALAAIAVLFAALRWVYDGHIRPAPKFRFAGQLDLDNLRESFAAIGHGNLSSGNQVQLFQNGQLFDALLDDFLGARDTIHLEAYLWEEGELAHRVAAVLGLKAREGVEVRVIIDAQGSKKLRLALERELRGAGVKLEIYHPFHPLHPFRYNRRDHRKLAIVDAHIAYIFGHGIADPWGGDADRSDRWRDTGARLRGPIVNQIQRAFMENWLSTAREVLAGARYFRDQPVIGESVAHLAYLPNRKGISAVQALYLLGIAAARSEIVIQNPYFIPGERSLEFLRSALSRGVRVRLMVPTDRTSDFPVVQHASHYFFGALLPYGAEILEYERSGIHQKVMVVDRAWCCIGSTNFDLRSFYLNDEVTLGLFDERVAAELIEAFEADAQYARVWTSETFRSRTAGHRFRDWLCALAAPHL